MCVWVCVGRHYCWAAGPLGLGFPVSLYIVVHLYAIHLLYTSTWYQTSRRGLSPTQQPPGAAASHLSRRRPWEAPPGAAPSIGAAVHRRGPSQLGAGVAAQPRRGSP
jgi:hypothetical protein